MSIDRRKYGYVFLSSFIRIDKHYKRYIVASNIYPYPGGFAMKKQVKTNVNLNAWELVALEHLVRCNMQKKTPINIEPESLKSLYKKLQNVNP